MADIPVTLSWRRSSGCLFCRSETIATLKPDKSGNFNISFTTDSTRFSSAYIEVNTPVNNVFYEPLASIDKKSSHSIDSVGNYTVNFELFPKTMLKINVKRLPNKGLTAASICYSFAKENSFGNYWWIDREAIKDTVLIVETAADIFTKITWNEYTGPGQYTGFQDSIKCILNKDSQFGISF